MLRVFSAALCLALLTNSLAAEDDEFSNEVGRLLDAHDKAFERCSASDDFESKACRDEASFLAQLADHGWCRRAGGNEELSFHRCSVFRSLTISAELSGYQFGFEVLQGQQRFSTEISTVVPTPEGTHERQSIGSLTIDCRADKTALLVIELETDYPDFAIRSDLMKFVANIKDGDGGAIAPALLSETDTGAIFFVFDRDGVLKILDYYSRDLSDPEFSDIFTVTFDAYQPRASLEFKLMPLMLSFDAMRYKNELLGHLNSLSAYCRDPSS